MSIYPHYRTGIGYDLHRLVEGRDLFLGGIQFDHPQGLLGHSDADVVLHAIMDALLGAAAMPDIGDLFPDSDPAFKNADSSKLLQNVATRMKQSGWSVVNVDCVVHAERPKIGQRKQEMATHIASLLQLTPDSVCVKATTNEGVGPVGRQEAIACTAVAMIVREMAD